MLTSKTEKEFIELLDAYVHQRISIEDEQLLMALLTDSTYKCWSEKWIDRLYDTIPDNKQYLEEPRADQIFARILSASQELPIHAKLEETTAISGNSRPRFTTFRSLLKYAAIVLLVAGTGLYFYLRDNARQTNRVVVASETLGMPGGNRAVLTLADGSVIELDAANDGLLASQGMNTVVKESNGQVSYRAADGIEPLSNGGLSLEGALANSSYNTISTPNGGQYKVLLPDGTVAWLNAASSIRFPVSFQKERKISVTGEVYLEVATDKNKPFIATTNGVEIQVLGTRFNINAYANEPVIKTTLLQGSIKVFKTLKAQEGVLLAPGQQAVIKDGITINKSVDLEQTVAWKNGVFNFNEATLEEFMRQIARWYDLSVVYEGAVPYRVFKGEMGRDLELSQVMELLTQFKIRYKITGKTITIESQ